MARRRRRMAVKRSLTKRAWRQPDFAGRVPITACLIVRSAARHWADSAFATGRMPNSDHWPGQSRPCGAEFAPTDVGSGPGGGSPPVDAPIVRFGLPVRRLRCQLRVGNSRSQPQAANVKFRAAYLAEGRIGQGRDQPITSASHSPLTTSPARWGVPVDLRRTGRLEGLLRFAAPSGLRTGPGIEKALQVIDLAGLCLVGGTGIEPVTPAV